jgi:hypothetical protein
MTWLTVEARRFALAGLPLGHSSPAARIKRCLKKVVVEAAHQSLSNATILRLVQRLRRTMRNIWVLTQAETIFLIAGITLIAGGGVWAAALPG